MTNQTLERRADEKQEIKIAEETITTKCHYCNEILEIPKEIVEEIAKVRFKFSDEKLHNPFLNKQYDGFYVSPCGSIYCNKDRCFWMFTED